MGLWTRLATWIRPQATDALSDIRHPTAWLNDWALGGLTTAGTHVSPHSAMTIAAYYACVRAISEDVGKMPLVTYRRRLPRGKERAPEHPLYALLHDAPNPDMESMTFRETLTAHALAWGNGYAEIARDSVGEPVALHPIHPSRVVVRRDDDGQVVYDIHTGSFSLAGEQFDRLRLRQENMLHIRGLGAEGLQGYSVAHLAAESLGVSLAAQNFGAAFFGNGAFLSGVLEHPGTLTDTAAKHLRESWAQQYSGPHNAGKPGILEEGMKWQQLGIPPEQGQFLETRQFQVIEVCFTPNTEIFTESGPRAIHTIRPGTLVLTHKGRWRRVKHVMRRMYSGEVVTVQAKGWGKVTGTPNHPFLVQTVKPSRSHTMIADGAPAWRDLGDLCLPSRASNGHRTRRSFDNLMMPRMQEEESVAVLDMAEWAGPHAVSEAGSVRPGRAYARAGVRGIGNPVRQMVSMGYDLGWVCGLFVADGSTSDYQAIFYLGAHEHEIIEALRQRLRKVFDVDAPTTTVEAVTRVVLSRTILAAFFAQFGHIAHEKRLPLWCMQQSSAFREGLIDGMVAGDGGVYKRDTYLRTTSYALVWQLRFLLWAEGKNTGCEYTAAKTSLLCGRITDARESWVVRWRTIGEKRGSLGVHDDAVYAAITVLERSSYDGLVYNLEVEEDESYTTLGGVVHNCRWFRMPPHKIQDLSGAKYANIEQQNLEYVTDTLLPWLVRWEQQLKRKLFADDAEYFAEHLTLGLLRGDAAARATFYKEMFGLAAVSPNDIREAENFNPIGPDGDTYFVASNNYTPLKFAVENTPNADAAEETDADEALVVPTFPSRNGSSNGARHGR